jgi:O-antigen/teichoic acid export membrane protein
VPTLAPRRTGLIGAGALVAGGSMVANVVSFALTVVLGRLLGTADFGAVGALLALAVVGAVPATAVQVVVARHVAGAHHAGTRDPDLGPRRVWAFAGAIGVAGCAAAYPLTGLLHLDSPAPVLWTAASLVPVTVVAAVQGAFQGRQRFAALAWLLVSVAVARTVGGVAGTAGGIAGVFAGITVATGVVAAVATAVRRTGAHPGRAVPAGSWRGLLAELVNASIGIGALLALTNVDVILARHFLTAHDAGLYAAGSVATKVAFWLPQAVATVAFPHLTRPDGRMRTLLGAAAVMGALGVATTAGSAFLGPPVLGAVLGPQYLAIGPSLGLFAAAGALGTLVQLVLWSGIAVHDRSVTALLAAGLVALLAVVGRSAHGSVTEIVTGVVAVLATVVVVGAALVAYRRR